MKQVNDILVWLSVAFGMALWTWSLTMGPVSPHFFLALALTLGIGTLISMGERRRSRDRQEAYITELNNVMAEYNTLSTDAMAHAEIQFSPLETEMLEAQGIIRASVEKLSGSLTGL